MTTILMYDGDCAFWVNTPEMAERLVDSDPLIVQIDPENPRYEELRKLAGDHDD